jgi:membrane-bound metal-dependent hydrolase YbcI (DUF457 family)
MPSPLAHGLLGYLAARGSARRITSGHIALALYVCFVANAPDLDYVPGLLNGQPAAFHRGWTHSLAAAIGAGLVGGLLLRSRLGFARAFGVTAAAWASHVVLDAITPDLRGTRGVPLLWPFSTEYFSAPLPVFRALGLHVGDTVDSFVAALFSLNTLRVFAIELLMFGPAVALVVLLGWRRSGFTERFPAPDTSARPSRSH